MSTFFTRSSNYEWPPVPFVRLELLIAAVSCTIQFLVAAMIFWMFSKLDSHPVACNNFDDDLYRLRTSRHGVEFMGSGENGW
ncbi:hypothetical protein M434DRAFT_30472 [Hypoxylon sp. CO27-5]|nr:hypothetical protein M434DRAFT_30472 [Hypoxylon sp. CO27-5]